MTANVLNALRLDFVYVGITVYQTHSFIAALFD